MVPQSSGLGRRLVAVLAVVLLPSVTACAATFGAETQLPYTPGEGTWANVDGLKLRNMVAVAPEEGQATLVGTIVNDGETDDRLVAIQVANGQATLPTSRVPVRAGEVSVLGVDTSQGTAARIGLEGEDLVPGGVVDLTFEFEDAPSVELGVQVVAAEGAYATVPPPVLEQSS
jgi:hypothetical protein